MKSSETPPKFNTFIIQENRIPFLGNVEVRYPVYKIGTFSVASKAEGDFLDVSKRDKWKKGLDAKALTLYMNYFYGYQGRDSVFSMSRITVDGEKLGAEQIDDHFATTRAVVKQAQGTFIEQAVTKSVAASYPLLANQEAAVALEETAGSHDLLPKASSYVYQKKTFVPAKRSLLTK